jgi:hypothetical protein
MCQLKAREMVHPIYLLWRGRTYYVREWIRTIMNGYTHVNTFHEYF